MNIERVEKILKGEDQSISYEDLVYDEAFSEYLSIKAEPIFDKHNVKPVKIRMCKSTEVTIPGFCASVNNEECRLEADNELYTSVLCNGKVSIKNAYEMILGSLFHEIGHVLYTDFEKQFERLSTPELKTNVISDKDHLEIISDILYRANNDYKLTYLCEKGYYDEVPLKSYVVKLVHVLSNAVEDAKVNKCLLTYDNEFIEFIDAFLKSEEIIIEEAKEIIELFTNEGTEEVITNYPFWCCHYAEHAFVPDKEQFPCSYEALPVIDRMLEEEDPDKFYDLALELVAIAYPLFEDRIVFKTEEEEEEYFRRQALKKQNN